MDFGRGAAMLADRYWILGSGTVDSVEPKSWSARSRDSHVLLILILYVPYPISEFFSVVIRLVFFFRSSYFSGGVFFLLCSRARYASTWFAYLDSLAFGFSLYHCLWPLNYYLSESRRTLGVLLMSFGRKNGLMWRQQQQILLNRCVTSCMFSYSRLLDLSAFEYICKLKWCFSTNGLLT